MTEKLYYKDAYIKEFDTRIISVNKTERGYDTILESTAFFPEEGGQGSDGGQINGIEVLSVYEENGVVHHILKEKPETEFAHGQIYFDERFEKMQCHTAEHILCGIIHRLYGLDNVGFHLGREEITFDISAPLTREELDEVERIANEAVFRNVKIETFFPTPEEAEKITYRSKLELKDNIRIVKIGDVDSCACCAPHVAYTGEVGIIKILDFAKHKGGLRIIMTAGRRALLDYRKKYENLHRISALLSEPQHTTAAALEKYMTDTDELRAKYKETRLRLAEELAMDVENTDGNLVRAVSDMGFDELRAYVNSAKHKVSGMLVALSGTEGEYKYIISSSQDDLSSKIKDINKALSGRGGGRGSMVQGTFSATLAEIEKYFS